jgi:hypothetical protein
MVLTTSYPSFCTSVGGVEEEKISVIQAATVVHQLDGDDLMFDDDERSGIKDGSAEMVYREAIVNGKR